MSKKKKLTEQNKAASKHGLGDVQIYYWTCCNIVIESRFWNNFSTKCSPVFTLTAGCLLAQQITKTVHTAAVHPVHESYLNDELIEMKSSNWAEQTM